MRCSSGITNLDLVEPLSRNRLTRQIGVVDQGNDLGLARSLLRLLEGFHDFRELAGRGGNRYTVKSHLYSILQGGTKPNILSRVEAITAGSRRDLVLV
jgi:hypothetical protein